MVATSVRSKAETTSTMRSRELPPAQLDMMRYRARLNAKPTTRPAARVVAVEVRTRRIMVDGCAPRLMRMPISCVRCVTA